MNLPTGDLRGPTVHAWSDPPPFEPSLALAILDDLPDGRPAPESAWDAAFIACLTGSPLWAETARRAFILATADIGARGVTRPTAVLQVAPSGPHRARSRGCGMRR